MAKKEKKFKKDYSSNRNNRKFSKDKREDVEKSDSTGYSYKNDSKWYIPDDNIRKQIGSFSFSNVIGVDNPLVLAKSGGNVYSELEIGNVMSIEMFPWIGENRDLVGIAGKPSAINIAGRKIYSSISAVNSKTTMYQPQDLTAAIIAVGELVSLVAFAQRAYGVAFQFNPRNHTLPRALLTAMAINPDSLLNDLSGFRMKLNKILTVASNVRMLRDIKYFDKCWSIYSHIFYDKNSAMGQYYVTYPAGWLELNESEQELGKLVFTNFKAGNTPASPSNPMTAGELLTAIENCVNTLMTSSTMNYVYTDIINYTTKQGGELLGFSYVPELYQVFPEFSETFMTQVHNMDWLGIDLTSYNIYDDPATNTLYPSDIWIKQAGIDIAAWGDKLLDFPYTDNPSVDDVIDACAYKIATQAIHTEDSKITSTYIAACDHPVNRVFLIGSKGSQQVIQLCESNAIGIFAVGMPLAVWNSMKWFETFDVKPVLYTFDNSDGTESANLNVPFANLNFWTSINYKQLSNMFQYYMLGLFDVEVKSGKPYSE